MKSCEPSFPVKGNGSGASDANDIDCPDIGQLVILRNANDPYRLHGEDNDGREAFA